MQIKDVLVSVGLVMCSLDQALLYWYHLYNTVFMLMIFVGLVQHHLCPLYSCLGDNFILGLIVVKTLNMLELISLRIVVVQLALIS